MATGRKRRMSLSTQVLVGLVLGLLAGVGSGEYMAPLQGVGKAFILLLQMPVLPYITLSLITGLGQLNYQQVKMLALKAGPCIPPKPDRPGLCCTPPIPWPSRSPMS